MPGVRGEASQGLRALDLLIAHAIGRCVASRPEHWPWLTSRLDGVSFEVSIGQVALHACSMLTCPVAGPGQSRRLGQASSMGIAASRQCASTQSLFGTFGTACYHTGSEIHHRNFRNSLCPFVWSFQLEGFADERFRGLDCSTIVWQATCAATSAFPRKSRRSCCLFVHALSVIGN